MAAIEAGGGDILKKAFDWSAAVNREIDALPESEKLPFEGVKETLAMIHEKQILLLSLPLMHRLWQRSGRPMGWLDILTDAFSGCRKQTVLYQ